MDAISDRKNKYAQGGTPIAMQASSWPTPKVVEIEENVEHWEVRRKKPGNKMMGPSLHVKTQQFSRESSSWRTPRATEYKNPDQSHAQKAKGLPVEHLSAQAKIWPTPRSGNPGSRPNKKGGKILNEEASSWPTPQNGDHKACYTGTQTQRMLSHASVEKEFKCNNPTGPLAQEKQKSGNESSKNDPTLHQPLKKRLNPNFVEWLMGVPVGWSLPTPIDQNAYKLWETESAYLLEQLH